MYILCSILVCGTNMKVCQHFLLLLALHALEPRMETTVRKMTTTIICSKLYFNFYYCRRRNSISKECRCISSWKIRTNLWLRWCSWCWRTGILACSLPQCPSRKLLDPWYWLWKLCFSLFLPEYFGSIPNWIWVASSQRLKHKWRHYRQRKRSIYQKRPWH